MYNFDCKKIDEQFLRFVGSSASKIIKHKRANSINFTPEEILELALSLEEFVIDLLKVDIFPFAQKFEGLTKIAKVKREFVQRRVGLNYKNYEGEVLSFPFKTELEFAEAVLNGQNLEELINYTRFALFTREGRDLHDKGMLFKLTKKMETHFEYEQNGEVVYCKSPPSHFHKTIEESFWEAKYCIYCHKQKKDYCRTKNPVSQTNGCPLDQKISEANLLFANGGVLSPLAVIMIDNPLCILTGERICNDCQKACIFQKQEGVDVPAIESAILTNVLSLKFGFEIYFLLTQWNPLCVNLYLPKKRNGHKMLVCGAGPSGIASAYYLLKEGCEVVMIEGLKVNPIEANLIEKPIEDIFKLQRTPSGFGGVMEYGITERWNKNFLLMARILLERMGGKRGGFEIYGGKRFGSDINEEVAKKYGFSHIFMCVGAGEPNIINLPIDDLEEREFCSLKQGIVNLKGVITASNFLMSFHLDENWINDEIVPPIAVIGGGLTAIDASTKAVLKGATSLFYRSSLKEAKSVKQNLLEVEEAFTKSVQFYENKIPVKFIKNKTGRVRAVLFKDGSCFEVNTVILALGTRQKSIKQTAFITKFGDLKKEYEGSVVKAIASVKHSYQSILNSIVPVKSKKRLVLEHKVLDLELENDVLKLQIKASFDQRCKPLNIFKLQLFEGNLHPIPITLFNKKGRVLTFYINIKGQATKALLNLKKGQNVSLMQAQDNLQGLPKFKKIVVQDEALLFAFQKHFKNVVSFADYQKSLSQIYSSDVKKVGAKTSKQILPLALFLVQTPDQVLKHKNHFIFYFNQMQCMLGGVCSRCLINTKEGERFLCKQNIICSMDVA